MSDSIMSNSQVNRKNLENILMDPERPKPNFDWIFPGFRPGMVAMLVAPGGTGKSFFSLQLAASIATGQSMWPNIPIQSAGSVTLIYFEDDTIDVQSRCDSIARAMRDKGMSIPDASMWFCYSWAGENLFLLDKDGNENAENIKELTELCTGQRLVVLDPLTHLHQTDENNSQMATHVMTILHRVAIQTQCGILVIHHTNKSATLNGQGDTAEAARGSTGLMNSCRLGLNLSRDKDNKEWLVLTWSKINSHAPIEPINLVRLHDGVLVTPYGDNTTNNTTTEDLKSIVGETHNDGKKEYQEI